MAGNGADPARSRIVLVGVPSYDDPDLTDFPAIEHNVTDLRAVLTDPDLGGFDPAHCKVSPASASRDDIGELLLTAAAEARDLLLFYYCGHGLLGGMNRELYLSTASTRHERPSFTALRFADIREAFVGSPASNRVVILDSCFSGKAIGRTLAARDAELHAQVQVDGTFTLAAAPAHAVALVRDGEWHTAFTGRLLQLLREGIPQGGEWLTLDQIYVSLLARLRAVGLPEPQRLGTGTTSHLGLVRNMARAAVPASNAAARRPENAAQYGSARHRDNTAPDAVPAGVVSATGSVEIAAYAYRRLVDRAEQAVNQIEDPGDRAYLRSKVAMELLRGDRARAIQLLARAEATALKSRDLAARATALASIAAVTRFTDQERAERLLAEAMKPLLPPASETFAARWFRSESKSVRAIEGIVREAAFWDADRALSVISLFEGPDGRFEETFRDSLLTAIALAVNDTASQRAVTIAQSITNPYWRGQALAEIARTTGARKPSVVMEILDAIKADDQRDVALAALAEGYAPSDTRRALQFAEWISADDRRARALAAIALAVAASSPDRSDDARQVVSSIADEADRIVGLARVGAVIARSDRVKAKAFIGEATRQADEIGEAQPGAAVYPLAMIAICALSVDPGLSWKIACRAERIARTLKPAERPQKDRSKPPKGDYVYKLIAYGTALIASGSAIAVTDVEQAETMFKEAYSTAWHPNVEYFELWCVPFTVEAIAQHSPDQAARIALRLLREDSQVSALKDIALRQGKASPARAGRIADKIWDLKERADALLGIARLQEPPAEHLREFLDAAFSTPGGKDSDP